MNAFRFLRASRLNCIAFAVSLVLMSCYQGLQETRMVEIIEPPEEPVEFSLNLDEAAGGAVSVSPQSDSYSSSELVRIAAVPEEGWHFTGWEGTEVSSANPLVFRMIEDEWVIPVFERDDAPAEEKTYTLRLDEAANGTVSVDPLKEAYAEGEFVKVTAVPDAGYVFSGWTGTASSVQNPLVVKMTGSVWLIPVFTAEETYRLVTDLNPLGGTVSLNPDKTDGYRYGELCTLTAEPSQGYQFDGWTGDAVGTDKNVFLTFNRDYQIQANFSIIPVETVYTLSLSAPVHGSITLYPDKTVYYENEIVRVTAVPDSGYMFSSWSGSGLPEAGICFDLVMDGDKSLSASFMKRGWTHLVYMAADNNLDSQAMNDLNEMEAAQTAGKAMTVLVLADRRSGNGDWADTRLYEIQCDPAGNSAALVSSRIDAAELGLSSEGVSELNLSDTVNLERFIAFAKRVYGADNYSLTIWGHGTGWRGDTGTSADGTVPLKAVAVDETSGTYMSLPELGDALSGEGLAVIGFDTCFGALLEVAYELRDCGTYLAASEGPTRETGWNYEALLSAVDGSSSAGSFSSAIVDQFKNSYAAVGNATISVINLSAAASLLSAFNNWSSSLASLISSASEQNGFRTALFDSSKIDGFWLTDTTSDYYADIASLVSMTGSLISSSVLTGGEIATVSSRGTTLLSALNSAVTQCWSAEYGTARKQLGVYVIAVNADKVPLSSHSAAYVRGSGSDTGDFVAAASGWVPAVNLSAVSVLNRVFYQVL